MGVETLMRDRFTAAREYAAAWERWWGKTDRLKVPPPRRDLELEALAEVLDGRRVIHCHSYRQDEILVLCRLGEEMGFRVGTFQHGLEGYKVAEALLRHGAHVSCFSDWWAYKVEVQDAIPWNAAILHEAGVCVTVNSDFAELTRRLNLEAAKVVRYGGVPEVEALKMVTLNAARQLCVEARVGSLEAGKDADFVIWSGPPLSTRSVCESTWIEGVEMFSLERDAAHRAWIASERRRLIQKVLASPDEPGGGEDGKGGGR
jgi:imidazolonepropionase-like amidohydrolase